MVHDSPEQERGFVRDLTEHHLLCYLRKYPCRLDNFIFVPVDVSENCVGGAYAMSRSRTSRKRARDCGRGYVQPYPCPYTREGRGG